MIQVNVEHISYFRKILRIKPTDSAKKIDINFENLSFKFHPKVKPIPKFTEHFEKMVIAREFLKYKLQNKEKDDEQIVENWNIYESAKVEELIESYKRMSKEEYEKAVAVEFVALKFMKVFLYIFLGIATLIAVFLIVYLFASGANIMGVIAIVAIAIVLVAFAFRGTRSPNFWGRKRY
ncbi:MAG: hypothetical protein C0596_10145 [Marinilabiliales bacterium]|nr:MAG: hypothetical protein C0596_10145 [Marinilabiliales bacterium]